MKIHIRYINDALKEWNKKGVDSSQIDTQVQPELIHLNDIISHPDFPNRWLMVLARHIDLSEPALTLYLDFAPGSQSGQDFPGNVFPFPNS